MNQRSQRIRSLFWGGLAVASLILQWFVAHPGEEFFSAGGFHYVSYFTIQTNVLMALWFLSRAFVRPGRWWGERGWRLAITVYATVTMIVFWILLSPTYHPKGWAIPANYGLHLVMPLAMLSEWLLDRPRAKMTWQSSLILLIYPLIYCVYAMAVGFMTGWFSYFFIDVPEQGVGLTVAYVSGLVAFFLLVALVLKTAGNKLVVQAPESQATAPNPSS